jgi:carbamoyltransferase
MKIIGIANDETASACLIIDGSIVAAISEERLTRIKMDNSWPENSIKYCLSEGGVSLDDIDVVAYGWSAGFNPEKHFHSYFDRIVYASKCGDESGLEMIKERFNSELYADKSKRNEYAEFVKNNSLESKSISFDHHECHAYSAFLCSDFDEGLVLTADGRGDFTSFTVSEFNQNSLNVLYRATSFDSFGFFYGRITALLGYTPHRHEGKITGLAAYGNPEKYRGLMKSMISVSDGKVYGHGGKYFKATYKNFSDELVSIIKSAKPEDIAAAAQVHLEECIVELASYYINKTSKKYLAMSGGVFANVRLNQCLLELSGVENVFISPHMGDGGLALGAAVATHAANYNTRPIFKDVFLGLDIKLDFPDCEIEKNGLEIVESSDLHSTILESIANGKVVGIARGRMEFGPRALCHRSIIFHCEDQSVNQWLNKRMHRTEFMPFAPVTAIDFADMCYINWSPTHWAAQFMTTTYCCTPLMKQKCPAVTHLDGTARPQIVSNETDEFMYKLLLRAKQDYGFLSLINTSFNVHEEPIICNEIDAMNGLKNGMIDLLLLGNKLVSRIGEFKDK